MKILMKTNVHKIPERLKEIDKDYFVLYDTKMDRYEVHNNANKDGSTLCLVLPFEYLDKRAVDYVMMTRVENSKRIYEDMKRHNERLETEALNRQRDFIDATARDIHRYVAPKNRVDTIPKDAYSTRFV